MTDCVNFEDAVIADYENDSAVLTDTEFLVRQPFERIELLQRLSELRIDDFL